MQLCQGLLTISSCELLYAIGLVVVLMLVLMVVVVVVVVMVVEAKG